MGGSPGMSGSHALVALTGLALLGCAGEHRKTQRTSFHAPFDFTDEFYRENGIDPDKLINRVTPENPSAVLGLSQDPTRNHTRILELFGGYDAVGASLYYPLPPGPFRSDGFLDNALGERAREIADKYRVFIFPRRSGDPLGSAASNRRADNLFDSSSGYFTENPLGLWRLTFPAYTNKALYTDQGKRMMDEIRDRNGEDLDGTPLIRRLSEVLELQRQGLLELRERPDDGSLGPPWVV